MKELLVFRAINALVDDEDYQWAQLYDWFATGRNYSYVARSFKQGHNKWTNKYLHREIMERQDVDITGRLVDHKDGNGFNDQRNNIRVATSITNQHNRRVSSGSSSFKGVHWDSTTQRWRAVIYLSGHYRQHLGYYKDERSAARAYDVAAKHYFGDFAKLNDVLTK